MTQTSKIIGAALLFVCCAAAAPASNGTGGAAPKPVPLALQKAAAKQGYYVDPFTLRMVKSPTLYRKVIAERMKKKIKPPKHHPPRTPNKPPHDDDDDDDDDDHGNGNGNGHSNDD